MAFFALVGWDAKYEPFCIGRWVPDFVVREPPMLVEVKPVTEVTSAEVLRGVQTKMWLNSRETGGDLLLLGDGPRRLLNSPADGAFGLFAGDADSEPVWETAILSQHEPHGGSQNFVVGGELTCCHGTPVGWDVMRNLWIQARNSVEASVRAERRAVETNYIIAPEVPVQAPESGTLAARMRCKLCERRYTDHPHVRYNDNRGCTGYAHEERWALCDGTVYTKGVSKKTATCYFHEPEWWKEVELVQKAMGCWAGGNLATSHYESCRHCHSRARTV